MGMQPRSRLFLLCLGGSALAALQLLTVPPSSGAGPAAASVVQTAAAAAGVTPGPSEAAGPGAGPPEPQRPCFSRAPDFDRALEGVWRPTGGSSRQHYAQVMGDRAALRRGDVDTIAAERWAAEACPLEDAMHSCYYHGEERARVLSERDFVATHCHLRRFNAGELLQKLPNTHVFFVGDSLMRQLWQAVGCHMMKYAIKTDVYWVKQSFAGAGNCPFKNDTHCYSFGPDCVVLALNGLSTKICYLMNHPDMSMDNWLENARNLKLSLTSREIVLFNGGVHFNPGYEERYWQFVQRVAQGAEAVRTSGGHFIWLETPPQHFPTEDGGYNHSARGGLCTPLKKFLPSWRNEIASVFMRQQGIDVLYTFDNGWSQWDAHVGATYRNDQLYESGDCTHFCLPGLPDLWARILFNMLTVARESK